MKTMPGYEQFVVHPRYGRGPRITGLNPDRGFGASHFVWWSSASTRVPFTAVVADSKRQQPSCVPVTHYFDERRVCVDCHRPFLFFADEQKHWYEELGFTVNSECVRCVPCRKREQ